MQRKHRSQMTKAEVTAVETLVKSQPSWVSRSHYIVRGRERHITRREVFEAIAFGSCVEINDRGRVLMRSVSGVCVVVEIASHTVITVWYNAPDDQHWGMDMSAYRWYVNATTWSQQQITQETRQ